MIPSHIVAIQDPSTDGEDRSHEENGGSQKVNEGQSCDGNHFLLCRAGFQCSCASLFASGARSSTSCRFRPLIGCGARSAILNKPRSPRSTSFATAVATKSGTYSTSASPAVKRALY